jgi:hypothetical protein
MEAGPTFTRRDEHHASVCVDRGRVRRRVALGERGHHVRRGVEPRELEEGHVAARIHDRLAAHRERRLRALVDRDRLASFDEQERVLRVDQHDALGADEARVDHPIEPRRRDESVP